MFVARLRRSVRHGRLAVRAKPTGFNYVRAKNGDVVISHHGRQAAVLGDQAAERFLNKLSSGDEQELMARATGNYKRGNERR